MYRLLRDALWLLCVKCATSSSFYDNPEQDEHPLPIADKDLDAELHRKWDFEVPHAPEGKKLAVSALS